MANFVIEGGIPLRGEITCAGSKNAALPILAATLLTSEECILDNLPAISDVAIMVDLLKDIGAKVDYIGPNKISIKAEKIENTNINADLVKKLRASILLMGPMLGRCGKISMRHPGGCLIGKRPLGAHLEALRNLGANIQVDNLNYVAKTDKLNGTKMYLDEISVTATENALMAAVLADGICEITPAACEPHIVDLANFLTKMGAKIEGAGTHTIKITGVDRLSGTQHKIKYDSIEAGTFAAAAAATQGHIMIRGINPEELIPIKYKLDQMGIINEIKNDSLGDYWEILKSPNIKASRIQIDTWPRFPTDLQPPFLVLATQANGTSLIHDWMYDGRLYYTDALIKMGANITICDPHRALVTGPTQLYGTEIVSPDIRAGIALVIAALAAKGKSKIENIELIDRGYENIEKRLSKLGAKIKRA